MIAHAYYCEDPSEKGDSKQSVNIALGAAKARSPQYEILKPCEITVEHCD